jgi:hypothetical protein
MVRGFRDAPGGKPADAGAKVAFAATADEGWKHAHRLWSKLRPPRRAGPGAADAGDDMLSVANMGPHHQEMTRF